MSADSPRTTSSRTTGTHTTVPWFPASLHGVVASADELRAAWCYVYVEEVSDGIAFLERWPWPLADSRGRLVWPPEDRKAVATLPEPLLRGQLYLPVLRRAPRSGDVFAVRHGPESGWGSGSLAQDARALLGDHAVDVSADARHAAKLAYQGSLVTPVPSSRVSPQVRADSRRRDRRLTARELRVDPPSDALPSGGGAR